MKTATLILVSAIYVTVGCGSTESKNGSASTVKEVPCMSYTASQECNNRRVCKYICVAASAGAGEAVGGVPGGATGAALGGQVCQDVCESIPECRTVYHCNGY